MKSKNFINKECLHCKEEFLVARSDQKFCSTSCRSANFAMLKRSKLIKPLKGIKTVTQESAIPIEDPSKIQFFKDVASSSIPIALNEIIKSLRGINDKDQMKILVEIKNNQIQLLKEIALNNKLIIELKEKSGTVKNVSTPKTFLGN